MDNSEAKVRQERFELVKHNRLMELVRSDAKIEELREFVANSGVNVNARNARTGRTPLMYPACLSTECVKLLLSAGADINATSTGGSTALIDAVTCGAKENVKILIAAGADVNKKDKNGFTAMWYALQCSVTECIDMLVDAGADVTLASNHMLEMLLLALGNHRILALLIEAGVDVNQEPERRAKNQDPKNPLVCAARECALPADFRARWHQWYISIIKYIQLLLGAGAHVNKIYNENMQYNALMMYLYNNGSQDEFLVKLLYAAGELVDWPELEVWVRDPRMVP